MDEKYWEVESKRFYTPLWNLCLLQQNSNQTNKFKKRKKQQNRKYNK